MKLLIIGHFAFNANNCDGQTVKTRNLKKGFEENTNIKLNCLDTFQWKYHPFKLLLKFFKFAKKSDSILMVLSRKGTLLFTPMVIIAKKIFKVKIYYSTIGGALAEISNKNRILCNQLKKFDKIFVETTKMVIDLNSLGYKNIERIPNFKFYIYDFALNDEILEERFNKKKFCIFSRIIEYKGITETIEIFKKHKNIILDIYGPIDESYKEKFDLLLKNVENVHYCGIIQPNNVESILVKYYMLLFPTKCLTEGIPGTLIDAIHCGLPIIASDWLNRKDILNNNFSIIFKLFDKKEFEQKILKSLDLPLKQYEEMCKFSKLSENNFNPTKLIKKYERTMLN